MKKKFLLCALCLFSSILFAKPKLHFAGFFILNQNDNNYQYESNFKFLEKELKSRNYKEIFTKKITTHFQQNPNPNFDFIDSNKRGNIESGDSIAFGLVFSNENFIFLPLDNNSTLLDGWLMTNIVVFDFEKKVLIDFKPTAIRVFEEFKSQEEGENWLKTTFTNQHLFHSDIFYQKIIDGLSQFQIDKRINRFQLANIEYSENALKKFPNPEWKNNFDLFAAQSFESFLTLYHPQLRLIPNASRVGAINDYKFGLRRLFNDLDSYTDLILDIPRPDYVFKITVQDTKVVRNEDKNNPELEILTYGVFNKIELIEPQKNEIRFSAEFRIRDLKQVKKTQGDINEDFKWSLLKTKQRDLFKVYTEELKNKNKNNLKSISLDENIIEDLNKLNDLINKKI